MAGQQQSATSEQTAEGGARPKTRWPIYLAYLMALAGGGFAADFALRTSEWSIGPVVLAWGLLVLWYWLYSVSFQYERPLLKYFALASGTAYGGLLAAFAFDRAPAQLAATAEGAVERGAVGELFWAGFVTIAGLAAIVLHAALIGRGRHA